MKGTPVRPAADTDDRAAAVIALLRPEILKLSPYRAADYIGGFVRLNANELPWRPPGDDTPDGLNRYPDPRPTELTAKLTGFYGVEPGQLLVTRGSSEAIDLLLRAFCRAGQDTIVISPPTFGMYVFYAQIQGARVRVVPLQRERGFAYPADEVVAAWEPGFKLAFVCSPNNPTGNRVPDDTIDFLCRSLAGRGVVVLDAAYQEFAGPDPLHGLLARHQNLIVLRTLSKALGLAGVRCGALIGQKRVVDLLGRALPQYCFPTGGQQAVLRCLAPDVLTEFARHRDEVIAERQRLLAALPKLPGIVRTWPSEGNFILVETSSAPTLMERARHAGILLRDFSWDPLLPSCVRITVGSTEENNRLLAALGS